MVDLRPTRCPLPDCQIRRGHPVRHPRPGGPAWRKDGYHFDKSLYAVVAYQQNLHFQQVFKVLELMGYDWAKEQMEHVAFGMVSYEGQAMSTRQGNIIYLDELLKRAQEQALSIIREKKPRAGKPGGSGRPGGGGGGGIHHPAQQPHQGHLTSGGTRR